MGSLPSFQLPTATYRYYSRTNGWGIHLDDLWYDKSWWFIPHSDLSNYSDCPRDLRKNVSQLSVYFSSTKHVSAPSRKTQKLQRGGESRPRLFALCRGNLTAVLLNLYQMAGVVVPPRFSGGVGLTACFLGSTILFDENFSRVCDGVAWEKHRELRWTVKTQTHNLQPSSPLYSSIRGVWELPVPWRRPRSRSTTTITTHLISEFPPPAERKVFHTTLITILEGRERGGRRMRGEAGGESSRRARPQPRFPMPTSDHQLHRGHGIQGERELTSSIQRGRERDEIKEKCQKVEAAWRPSHLPLCNLRHSTGTTWC